jgi:hypothetical protein
MYGPGSSPPRDQYTLPLREGSAQAFGLTLSGSAYSRPLMPTVGLRDPQQVANNRRWMWIRNFTH